MTAHQLRRISASLLGFVISLGQLTVSIDFGLSTPHPFCPDVLHSFQFLILLRYNMEVLCLLFLFLGVFVTEGLRSLPKLHGGRFTRTTRTLCRIVPRRVVPCRVVATGLLGSRVDDAGGVEGSSFDDSKELKELIQKIKETENDIANVRHKMAAAEHLLSGSKDANATVDELVKRHVDIYKKLNEEQFATMLGALQGEMTALQGKETVLLTMQSKALAPIQVEGIVHAPLDDRKRSLISSPFVSSYVPSFDRQRNISFDPRI